MTPISDTAVDIRGAVIAAYSRQLLDDGKGWVPDGIDMLSAVYVDKTQAAIQDRRRVFASCPLTTQERTNQLKMVEVRNLQNALFQRQMGGYKGNGWYVTVIAHSAFRSISYDGVERLYPAKDYIVFKAMNDDFHTVNGCWHFGSNHLFDGPHTTKKDAQAWLALYGPLYLLAIAEEPLVFDALASRTAYYPLRVWSVGWQEQEQAKARCR